MPDTPETNLVARLRELAATLDAVPDSEALWGLGDCKDAKMLREAADALTRIRAAEVVLTQQLEVAVNLLLNFNERDQRLFCRICHSRDEVRLHKETCPVYAMQTVLAGLPPPVSVNRTLQAVRKALDACGFSDPESHAHPEHAIQALAKTLGEREAQLLESKQAVNDARLFDRQLDEALKLAGAPSVGTPLQRIEALGRLLTELNAFTVPVTPDADS